MNIYDEYLVTKVRNPFKCGHPHLTRKEACEKPSVRFYIPKHDLGRLQAYRCADHFLSEKALSNEEYIILTLEEFVCFKIMQS